ncbi:E3 ubiquitin-protein ligase SINAT2 [Orchesella cincta]|uniref:E3 ubiquitin-protein ligase SINAT2 n=1 Tax=Orchesella cincta TaxID=48709 RepID=A0A1D2NMD3_ORCCI|nr:E3 ubiquitin-protein ligase SINAT2 [Orchesella cincta]
MEESQLGSLDAFSLSTMELFEHGSTLMEESVSRTNTEASIHLDPKQAYESEQVFRPNSKPKRSEIVSLLHSTEDSKASSTKSLSRSNSEGKIVDCRFKSAGCTEKLPKGTLYEKEHHQNCQFRPIPCLLQPSCSESVPFHNFLLHHMNHFIYPIYSATLNTSVIFKTEDFKDNQRWSPRWMNCYNRDFFVMVSHKLPGMWYVWVWMLGSPDETAEYLYDVEISKSSYRKLGTFPVLSVRTAFDEIEKYEACMSMTDFQVKRISQIRESIIGSFEIDLMIYKSKGHTLSPYGH